MDFKDYYATLGVARDADAEAIKKAFRKLARKYHPDVSKEKDAETRMKEVNEAYAVLSDPEKRAAYDRVGEGYRPGEEFRPPPGWDAGFEFRGRGPFGDEGDFSSFFNELFRHAGHGAAHGRAHGHGFHGRGEDRHARVLLDLEDAYVGAMRQITLEVPEVDERGRPRFAQRTLNVRIPKGVCEGQFIRLGGQGGPGPAGPGDLLLEVGFRPHGRFRVEGRDVWMELRVAPWESALGAVLPVRLPDGSEVRVRLPEGAQSGQQLRVRGKGLPADPPGDLMLEVQVRVPRADSPRARELYEAMARELAFDPRED